MAATLPSSPPPPRIVVPPSPTASTAASSRRTSLDTTSRSQATSPSRPPAAKQRRNRAALREFYNLKASDGGGGGGGGAGARGLGDGEDVQVVRESELDAEGFDVEAYVRGVLGREGLEGVLRVEGALVNEIKALDGERKALVYDNYSKLIAATDTIRKMRTNMDPLTPTTATLTPAISHIAEVSATLATSLQEHLPASPTVTKTPEPSAAEDEQKKQRETVRWVLNTPFRLRKLVGEGRREDAEREWEDVKLLLDKWEGTKGVDDIRRECEAELKEVDAR
ncbi:MAG: hypothetical protein M1819_000558 [Sarea resinae]|nr:MAG: hypothetical protein M1819_000558 [Sarea resinae]